MRSLAGAADLGDADVASTLAGAEAGAGIGDGQAIDPEDAGFDEIEMDDEGLDPETEQGGRDAATKE